MAKQNHYSPSDAELEILNIIWETEPTTVREIHDRIVALGKDVGYTTVLKQVQRLTEKGVLDKQVTENGHFYKTLVAASDVKGQLAGKILQQTFGGSAVQMLMHALGNQKASEEELNALKQWLDQQTSEQ